MPVKSMLESERLFLTDGGIETTLIFDDGIDLPDFAAFHLLRNDTGRMALQRYYARHIRVAQHSSFGFILESPTWRASRDWGDRLGYSKAELQAANAAAISMMIDLRATYAREGFPMLVSGCVGPRGDGYVPCELMRAETAEAYHDEQVGAMLGAGAELITAITMTNAPEAIGIARAVNRRDAPVVISFTVETDGRLPDRTDAARSNRRSRCGNRQCACLLHDQLRAPDAFRRRARTRGRMGAAHQGHPRQRLDLQPRRTQRSARTRSRRPSRSCGALSGACEIASPSCAFSAVAVEPIIRILPQSPSRLPRDPSKGKNMTNPADAMPFSKLMGVNITGATKDHIVGKLTVRPDLCTSGQIMHGGAIMAFADALGAIGAFMNLPEGSNGTTTIESKTNFLGAAPEGETVTGEATPVQIGKRLSVWQTRITRGDGRAVALVTQTQLVL